MVIYLFLLGDIRRILNLTGDFPKFDPLLLVGPVFSIIITLPILLGLRLKDNMSKAVLALMIVMTLEIVNPKQGPVVVGIAGAMFYLVPLLWFWLGRQYGTFNMLERLISGGLVPLGLLAAVLGIVQTYIGFLPWEKSWIDNVASHLSSINLGGGFYRAFGYSVNGVEFSQVMMTACTAATALFFAGRRVFLLPVPILAWGIFLASSRGAVLHCLFGVAAAWALSSRSGRGWLPRMAFALALGIGVIGFSAVKAASPTGSQSKQFTSAADAASQHQIEGFAHPTDAKHSTAALHSQMVVTGIMRGITYPIGYGLGSATLGSSRLGGDASASGSAEFDVSDVFTTTGVVGGFLYLYIFLLILQRSVWFGRSAPKFIGLPTLGIMFSLLGQWLALGSYAMTPLTWLLIGAISRAVTETPRSLPKHPSLEASAVASQQRAIMS